MEIQGVHITGTHVSQPCKCIVLILVYRPPRGKSDLASLKIQEYIKSIPNYDRKEIFLLGDFNWDVSLERGSGMDFVDDMLNEFGLKQLILCPTRIGANRASILDLVLTNAKNILRAGCLSCTPSDHYPVFCIKKREKVNIEYVEIRKRKMCEYNLDFFSNRLKDLDWSIINLLQDVNEMWNMLYNGIIF